MAPGILVVHQSRSGSTDRLVKAFLEGVELAAEQAHASVAVEVRGALEATSAEVLAAAAIVVATPEHFGYMSGAVKHFFEEIFYDCVDHTVGRSWQLIVKAGNDGAGTIESVQRIVAGLGWSEFRPPLLAVGEVAAEHLHAAAELGATMAVSLDAGLA